MICISEQSIREKAAKMPIGYLAECQEAALIRDGQWCFDLEAFSRIRRKYRGYAPSQADPYRDRISGCCDRADQY